MPSLRGRKRQLNKTSLSWAVVDEDSSGDFFDWDKSSYIADVGQEFVNWALKHKVSTQASGWCNPDEFGPFVERVDDVDYFLGAIKLTSPVRIKYRGKVLTYRLLILKPDRHPLIPSISQSEALKLWWGAR